MAARIRSDQSSLFWVLLGLMLLFYFVDLGTEFMVQAHITATQIGGDISERAFEQFLLVAVLVANAGGRSLVAKLESAPVELEKVGS